MAIKPKTPGIHHISLRCKNMETTKKFYQFTLGLPLILDTPSLFGFAVGTVMIGFRQADLKSEEDVFNPMDIGMDHLAIACETEEELLRVAIALKEAGVENTGIKLEGGINKQYVAFKDPDRIQWEFYMI